MSLIDETTKPKAPARSRKPSVKKMAPKTRQAIKSIRAADAAQEKPKAKTSAKKKAPKPEMREVYRRDQTKRVISDLINCHISQWKGFDTKSSKKAAFAKAIAFLPQCAARIGTHSPKLQNSRIHVSQIAPILAVDEQGRNLPLFYLGGLDGYQDLGQALLQPIRFEDEAEPKCIFERILERGDLSDPLVTAFLGPATPLQRVMLRRAVMRENYQGSSDLVTDNFAMIYVPDEDFGDMVMTPLQAHAYFDTVNDIRWMTSEACSEAGIQRPLRHAEVIDHMVASKSSNIGCSRPVRSRVTTFLPKVTDQFSAATYRYVSGGPFPRLRDDRLVDMMQRAVELFETTQGPDAYNNTDIRRGIRALVAMMRDLAQEHIDQVLTLAESEFGWSPETEPDADEVLQGYRPPLRSEEARRSVRNFLASSTFHDALKKA